MFTTGFIFLLPELVAVFGSNLTLDELSTLKHMFFFGIDKMSSINILHKYDRRYYCENKMKYGVQYLFLTMNSYTFEKRNVDLAAPAVKRVDY